MKKPIIGFNISALAMIAFAASAGLSQALDVKVTGVPGSGQTTWVFNASQDTLSSSVNNRLNPINAFSLGGNGLINGFEHADEDLNGEIVHGNPARQGGNVRGFLVTGGVKVSGRAYGLKSNGTESDFDVDEIAIDNDTKTVRVSQGFHIINGESIEVFKDVEEPIKSDDFVWGIDRAQTFVPGEKIVFENYTVTFNIDISEFGEGDTRIYISGDKFTVSSSPSSARRFPLTMSFEAIGPPTPIADLVAFDQHGEELQIGTPTATLPIQETDTTKSFTFSFLNRGELDLDIQSVSIEGPDATQFSLTLPDISQASDIATDGQMSYTIHFNPTGGSGSRNATIKIISNDIYTPTFTFAIKADTLSRSSDGDEDGLSDWAEFSLQGLGFDHARKQTALVETLLNNANTAGLFKESELAGIQGAVSLVDVNKTTNTADLVIQFSRSENLRTFTPMILLPSQLRVDEDGNIRYTVDASSDVNFFRAGLK